MAYVSRLRLVEEVKCHQHPQDSGALSLIHPCFVCDFFEACLFPDGDSISDFEVVNILPAGASVMHAGEEERVVYGCGDQLEEGLTCFAEVTAGVEYILTGAWERIDTLGSNAGEEWESIFREREGREGILLQVIVDGSCEVFDLGC